MLRNPYTLLVLLILAYILSFIDRYVMSALVGPIREDFNISDFEYGLLNGVAFSLLYATLAVPVGYLADRYSRKNIIGIGVAFWSAMTAVCGLATGFTSLFLARMGVGVGEASLSPAAHSILSDSFDRDKLPQVMALFTLGIPIGVGCSYIIAGSAYEYFASLSSLSLPLIGSIKPWQATFMLVAAPGALISLLVFFMPEPARKNVLSSDSGKQVAISIPEAMAYLNQQRRVYLPIFIGIALVALLAYGHMMWFVAHMSRSYGVPEYEISQTFGKLHLLFGIIGTLAGAYLAKVFSAKKHVDAGLRVTLFFIVFMFVPYLLSTIMPSINGAYAMTALCVIGFNGYFGVAIAALHLATPNQLRGQVSALLLLSGNVSGLIIGPMLVGFLSDKLFSGNQSLGFALLSLSAVLLPLAGLLIYKSLRPYRELVAQQAELI